MKNRSIACRMLALASLLLIAVGPAWAQEDSNEIGFEELMSLGRGVIHEIAISPEGERLAVASAIGIWLYSIPQLEDIAWFETEGPVTGIDWSPDGQRLASGGNDGIVFVWDLVSEREIWSSTEWGRGRIGNIAWSPEGDLIALRFSSNGVDNTI